MLQSKTREARFAENFKAISKAPNRNSVEISQLCKGSVGGYCVAREQWLPLIRSIDRVNDDLRRKLVKKHSQTARDDAPAVITFEWVWLEDEDAKAPRFEPVSS